MGRRQPPGKLICSVLAILLGSSADLDAIVALESSRDTTEWLGETGPAWHQRALADPDQEYLLAEDENGHLLGFAVLAGLKRPGRRVEHHGSRFTRAVGTAPSRDNRRGTGKSHHNPFGLRNLFSTGLGYA